MAKLKVLIVPVTAFQQNCAIVMDDDSKVAAVVDPGGDLARIEDALRSSGCKVAKILITHGHLDHAGGAAELREKLAVPVEGPQRGDASLLQSLAQAGAGYGLPGCRPVTPDRWLEDGDEVQVGGLMFRVITAPGHSPGSVVFFDAEHRFALMGDVLFQGSIGRTDLPGGDHETLLASIRDKLLPLGDDVVFLPGHGAASRLGDERINNPFLQA